MPGLAVPSATAAPTDHADWLELEALRSADRNSSMQDLASALRRTGSSEEVEEEGTADEIDDRGGETIEPIAEAAFEEIEDRDVACQSAYPFNLSTEALQGSQATPTSVYVFLLLLSRFGKDAGPSDLNVAQLFEEISGVAIANCMGGEGNGVQVYHFGFPRRIAPAGFRAAVDDLCQRTGEGSGPRDRPTRRDQKDASLDIVAWRAFPDNRRGIIMAWGQCATGQNWHEKVSELDPAAWSAAWLMERPAVVPLPAFFVPHRLDRDRWDVTAINGGVLFDRCRIAAFARPLPRELRDDCGRFSRHVIAEKVRL